ncbi:MAG: PKD domain-containing protein, partial [Vicinamibacterales bacterium]
MRNLFTLVGAIGLALLAGCTVKRAETPALAGPSEFALGLTLQAVPDSLVQDGSSQAVIMIEAHGPNNSPVRALPLRAEIWVNGTVQDFGSLSTKSVVTGDDGRARVVYTAPPASSLSQRSNLVTITVIAIGGDFRGETFRQVDIRLVPQGVIGPSNPGLVADFDMAPSPATAFTSVHFDGSKTTDGGVRCGAACSYSWNFGDGSNGSGLTTTHEFRSVGTFLVSLTVVDSRGATAVTSKSLVVNPGTPPTAVFRISPTAPAVSADIFFTAEESKAAAGRRIVSYNWNFGDGRTGSGVTISRRYDSPGSYAVLLTVTDDAEQKATAQQTVVVGASGTGPVATLTFSPTAPLPGASVFFDGTASTGPTAIVNWEFNYGDGTIEDSAVGRQSHVYPVAGTYLVRLT